METDAAYISAHSSKFDAVVGQAIHSVIRERAPDPILRIGEQLLQTGLAVDGGPLFPSSSTEETASDQWSADAWVRGAGVHRIVAAALQRAAMQQGLGDGPQAVLGLLRATKDRATLSKMLCTGALLSAVVQLLWQETQKLHGATAATNQEAQDKFKGAIELSYGGLDKFFGGLGEVVGPPDPNVDEAMDAEHLEGSESKQPFETGNYGVITTSETEWLFVTCPTAAPPEQLHLDRWPEESPEKLPDRTRCRRKTALAELDGALAERNEQLKQNHHPEVILSELKAAKSYTGPVRPRPLPQTCALLCHRPRPSLALLMQMFVKYNGVLRGMQSESPFLRNTMITLCCPKAISDAYLGTAKIFQPPTDGTLSFEQAKDSLNKYATTLHAINSAIIKLGKLTVAKKVAPRLSPRVSLPFPQSPPEPDSR